MPLPILQEVPQQPQPTVPSSMCVSGRPVLESNQYAPSQPEYNGRRACIIISMKEGERGEISACQAMDAALLAADWKTPK